MPMNELRPARLVLADGTLFEGEAIGAEPAGGVVAGEVVFNTASTGYQEILTDPSYAGQIITFTSPHIGNYGVVADDDEARQPFARGIVVRDLARAASANRCTSAGVGGARRRDCAAPGLHLQAGRGCAGCGGAGQPACARRRWPACGGCIRDAQHYQRQHLCAGDDDCREGGRPDTGECGAGAGYGGWIYTDTRWAIVSALMSQLLLVNEEPPQL